MEDDFCARWGEFERQQEGWKMTGGWGGVDRQQEEGWKMTGDWGGVDCQQEEGLERLCVGIDNQTSFHS